MNQDYSMFDDGGCECLHCLCESTREQVEEGERKHFDDCPMLIDEEGNDNEI